MSRARFAVTALVALLSCGCNIGDRLGQIGKVPALNPIDNPTASPGYRPVTMPMPEPQSATSAGANSLWRSGSRAFFRDQRARRVGDVLTVAVTIADKAKLSNESTRSRNNSQDVGVGGLFGLESQAAQVFSGAPDAADLVGIDSKMNNTGKGGVNRNEDIKANVAAVVIQILPNGNMVVQGRQEVRVNYEVRELYVAGVIRPEDITPQNTIAHQKVAELRVAYGGRGQISDVQQPPYGSQALDILLPF